MSVVYFVGCAGRIKIGVTKNLGSRIRSLKTSAPGPLNVIATIPGTRHNEAALHKALQEFRISGEWFADCEAVRLAINSSVTEHEGTFAPDINAQPEPVQKPRAPDPYITAQSDREFEKFISATDIMLDTLKAVSLRFGALIESPVFSDFGYARDLEQKLQARPGSIIKKIYPCDDPVTEHRAACAILKRCYDKFGKVSDRMTLALFKEDTSSSNGLCRAAEVLIEQAEGAFAKLKTIHRPIVNSDVRAA